MKKIAIIIVAIILIVLIDQKCHLFGHGDPYYTYPDELATVGKVAERTEDIQAAAEERDRAGEVFWHFHCEVLLPVLSYIYGLWINVLYSFIALAWCVGAAGGRNHWRSGESCLLS